uniref:Phospholipid scramblase n=1 Tax=Haptolina ericina TaxID=156174 RepID=A0A7S3FC67_9EUKA|mmetsp:Transcript_63807/g.142327  ORF Transcript_63807/g.142327 Transcript_63807/m.142327 type:complete len:238 (+) Transcript_63807:91-804(+)
MGADMSACGAAVCAPTNRGGDLSKTDGKMHAEDSADGHITSKVKHFVVKEKLFSWEGSFFNIKDERGEVAYRVTRKQLVREDQMIIYTKSGQKLCLLQKRIMTITPTFHIFTYMPNAPGQISTDSEGGTPVFRFALIQQEPCGYRPRCRFSLYLGKSIPTQIWTGEMQSGTDAEHMVIISADSGAVVGYTEQVPSALEFAERDTYAVSAARHMDALSLIVFAISADEMRSELTRRLL